MHFLRQLQLELDDVAVEQAINLEESRGLQHSAPRRIRMTDLFRHQNSFCMTELKDFIETNNLLDPRTRAEDNEHWLALARYALSAITISVERLVRSTIQIAEDLLYWQSLLNTMLWRYVFRVQSEHLMVFSHIKCYLELCYPRIFLESFGLLWTMLPKLVTQRIERIKENIELLHEKYMAAASVIGHLASATYTEQCSGLKELSEKLTRLALYATSVNVESESASLPYDMKLAAERLLEARHRLESVGPDQYGIQGIPSILERYWPLAIFCVVLSPTLLNIFTFSKRSYKYWLLSGTDTVISFWRNWIIEPAAHVLATIRHDEQSTLALIGKQSLSADMDSLVRMVVAFTQQYPEFSASENLTELQRTAREGDLTSVLRAYESELHRPFYGIFFGPLIQSLLIQIQKTKVDVELAISGIDKLLKSQELVFTCIGARWDSEQEEISPNYV